jgi:hypothetical protein
MCDRCDTRCFSISSLELHVRSVHEKVRPFHCKVCNNSYAAKLNLKRHACKGRKRGEGLSEFLRSETNEDDEDSASHAETSQFLQISLKTDEEECSSISEVSDSESKIDLEQT